MGKILRVGVIGADPDGGWVRESHIPAIRMMAGLELAAVAGKTQSSAEAAARAFGIDKAYGHAADLFADPDIDLVTVAVTLPAHRDLLLAAFEAGKHVYCEYPLGLDAHQSRMLADAAGARGVHAAIGLQARANPAIRRARHLLATGAIGRVLTASMVATTAGFGPQTGSAVAYTEDPANGVTVLTIQAAHAIDIAIALLGGLDGLSALASTQYPQISIGDGPLEMRRTHDHLLLQARLSSGAAFAVEVAGGRPPPSPFRLEIIGEAGTIALEGGAPRGFQSGRLRLLVDRQPQTVDEGELACLPDAALNVGATYMELSDNIRDGCRTVVGLDHAARLARLMEDVAISSQSGQQIAKGDWPTA